MQPASLRGSYCSNPVFVCSSVFGPEQDHAVKKLPLAADSGPALQINLLIPPSPDRIFLYCVCLPLRSGAQRFVTENDILS